MAEMKDAGAATSKWSVTTAAFLLILSWETVQSRALTIGSVDKKINVTVNTNMTVNVHAQIPGSDSPFTTTVYPGITTLRIPFPPSTNLHNLSFPMQISVEPTTFLGIPVTGPASSTIMVAPDSIVEIQGYLTQIINAVLGLATVYYKMLISAFPSMLPGVPPVTVPIPSMLPGVPPVTVPIPSIMPGVPPVTVPIPGIDGFSGAPVPTTAYLV